MICFFFKSQWNVFKCPNKSNRFYLKIESDEETAAAIIALRKRFVRVKLWLGRRINQGFYETLVQELRFKDKLQYKKLLRMTPHDYDEILILGLIQDDVSKTNSNMRAWFDTSKHKISRSDTVFGHGWR